MRVYVNDRPVDLPTGMTVRHALIHCGLVREIEASKKVYDEWENEMGIDGALSDGMKIYVKPESKHKTKQWNSGMME